MFKNSIQENELVVQIGYKLNISLPLMQGFKILFGDKDSFKSMIKIKYCLHLRNKYILHLVSERSQRAYRALVYS